MLNRLLQNALRMKVHLLVTFIKRNISDLEPPTLGTKALIAISLIVLFLYCLHNMSTNYLGK